LGRISSACIFAGLGWFAISLVEFFWIGASDRLFVLMALAGMFLGFGGILESHLATKISFMGIITSIVMSKIGKKLKNSGESKSGDS